MPSNNELSARAKQLVAEVQSYTQSAKQHSEEYKKLSNEAYENLQKFLTSKGVTTVDEWLKICLKELTPEDAAQIQKLKTLADLEPAHGLTALVQPTEIAKFIASWYIIKGGLPLFQAAALNAKAWYYNYLVINRLPVVEAGEIAGEVEVGSIASSTEELTEAAEFLEADEVSVLVTAAEAEVGEVIAAEAAVAAEVGTVAAAEAASAWNVVFLGIGAVVLAGTYAYSKIKEGQDADKLRDTIAKLATARLYSLVAEKSLLAQTDNHSLLGMLNQALKEGNVEAQDFFRKQALKIVPAIDVRTCYDELHQQDETTHAMTETDPSFDDMVQRHANEVQEIKKKGNK